MSACSHRIRINSCGNQAGIMRHVDNEDGTHLMGDLPKACKIDNSWIGAGARDDHLGPVFVRQAVNFFIVDALVLAAHAIGYDLVEFSRKVQGMCRASSGRRGQDSFPE